jgi:hypothetical protein
MTDGDADDTVAAVRKVLAHYRRSPVPGSSVRL